MSGINTEWPAPAIILFGSPGSGKGTQAKLLEERFGWPHVSTGDMLRTHIAAEDSIGREVQGTMKAGRLVPDELVNQQVEERLSQPDCRDGVILDGYPRTVPQAEVLLGIVERFHFRPGVVHLVVDAGRIVRRLSGRRQCPVCGTLYSIKTHPPKVNGICDLDGAVLVTREDDQESVIRERLQQYDLQTRPLLEFFRNAGLPMIETQGASKAPEEIMATICEALMAAGLIPVAAA
ncbi:MAG TPA: nucleoside monophosphate kinase [Bryobacteraceae bacterium]|nr:nucleoside monophosphate kinase [Bryobacteraceae bacterium]